jgi:hypothetical protein
MTLYIQVHSAVAVRCLLYVAYTVHCVSVCVAFVTSQLDQNLMAKFRKTKQYNVAYKQQQELDASYT